MFEYFYSELAVSWLGTQQDVVAAPLGHDSPDELNMTDDNKEQSIARSGGNLGNKGIEAGVTALKMIDFKRKLSNS